MHYIGSHENVNWLFVLACLSILQWIITLILVYRKYNILGTSITENAFKAQGKYAVKDYNEENRVSFTHDYFYIYWNIYPIIFYMFFYYLDTSWDAYLNQINLIGGEEARQVYISWFKTFNFFDMGIDHRYIDIIVLLITTAIAYGSTFLTQLTKQKQFIDENNIMHPFVKTSKTDFLIPLSYDTICNSLSPLKPKLLI